MKIIAVLLTSIFLLTFIAFSVNAVSVSGFRGAWLNSTTSGIIFTAPEYSAQVDVSANGISLTGIAGTSFATKVGFNTNLTPFAPINQTCSNGTGKCFDGNYVPRVNGFKFGHNVTASALALTVLKNVTLDFNASNGFEVVGTGIVCVPTSQEYRRNELAGLSAFVSNDCWSFGDIILAMSKHKLTVTQTTFFTNTTNTTYFRLTITNFSALTPYNNSFWLDPTITHQSFTQFSNGAGNSTIFNNDSNSVYADWYAGNNSFTPSGTYFSQALILNRTANNGSINTVNWTWFEAPAVFTAGNESVLLDLHFENDTKDASRYNNTGAIVGNTSAGMLVTGIIGNAFSFDGVNDYINLTGSESIVNTLKPSDNFSLMFWFNLASNASAVVAIEEGDSNNNGSAIYICSGRVGYSVKLSGDSTQYNTAGTPIGISSLNSWHHVALTYNSSDGGAIYLDGVAQTKSILPGCIPTVRNITGIAVHQAAAITIGSRTGSAFFLNGSLDELHFFNRSLSAFEIAQLYGWEKNGAKGNAGFIQNTTNVSLAFRTKNYTFNDTGLVGWWDLGDSSGNETQVNKTLDLSGNNGNGNLYNNTVCDNSSGIIGKACNFDVKYIKVPDSAVLRTVQNFTVSVWLKIFNYTGRGTSAGGATSNPAVIFKGTDADAVKDWGFTIDNVSGKAVMKLHVANVGTWGCAADTNTNLNLNAWIYAVMVFNGTTCTNYVNGTKDTDLVFSGTFAGVSTNPLFIGAYSPASTNNWLMFNGSIDDVKIWNRTLSATEIANLYNGGNPVNSTGQESNWSAFSQEYYGGNATVTNVLGAIGQYRASFNSTNLNYSPFLQNVSINYNGIVTTPPTNVDYLNFTNITSSTPTVYAFRAPFSLNLTWTTNLTLSNVSLVLFSIDGVNYSASNISATNFFYAGSWLAAGTHYWLTYANTTTGVFNVSTNTSFTVARAPVFTNVSVNSTSQNRTLVTVPSAINVTAVMNSTEGTIETLYNNTGVNMLLNSSTSNTSTIIWIQNNNTGYLFTARYNQTTNYSASGTAMQITFLAQSPNYSNISSLTPSVYAFGFPTWFNVTWTDNSAVSQVLTQIDSVNITPTQIGNVYFVLLNGLAAGQHSWLSYANNSAGVFNATTNMTFTIARAPVNVRVLSNYSTANVTYGGIPNVLNWTALGNATEGTLELLYNNTANNLQLNSTATNYTQFFWLANNATVYYISARFNQTQNYSAGNSLIAVTLISLNQFNGRCYTTQELRFLENTDSALAETFLFVNGSDSSPALGATATFQIWNTSGLVSATKPMIEIGGGVYAASFNLTRGVYTLIESASFSGINTTVTHDIIIVPACALVQPNAGMGMDFILWAFFVIIALALILWGLQNGSQFFPIMGGFILSAAAAIIISQGVDINFITVNTQWTLIIGFLLLAIALLSMFWGALSKFMRRPAGV